MFTINSHTFCSGILGKTDLAAQTIVMQIEVFVYVVSTLQNIRWTRPDTIHNWAAFCEKVPNILSRCHTKRVTSMRGRTHPSFQIFFFTAVLLLVWQRLRTLGTFSHNAAHIYLKIGWKNMGYEYKDSHKFLYTSQHVNSVYILW